ncbi:MAG: hypothetical protein HY611_06565 [Elusimicrobia bacterium]|nr:hypothetical protein [Elusimicrobiota bacterium]
MLELEGNPRAWPGADAAMNREPLLNARRRQPATLLLSLVLMAAVWAFDHLTGAEISFSIFYLLPIAFAVWQGDERWAMPLSFLAAAGWLAADLLGGRVYSNAAIPYWNAVVRLGFFLTVSILLARLKNAYRLKVEISNLKSSMLSVVSHEFGNALNTLTLAALLLKEGEKGDIPANRARCYAALESVVQHLHLAVSNFLNLSRLESGRFDLKLRPTAIRTLVEETLQLLQPLMEEKKIQARLDVPAEIVPIQADPDALALVMSNLVGNAVKYTPPGGCVTLEIRPMSGAPDSVLIAVADTGIGIPKEDHASVTSGFFRSEAGQMAAKGYGIGLKVSREILENHGSRLQLESEPGKGSRFFFTLPVWKDPAAAPHPAAASTP